MRRLLQNGPDMSSGNDGQSFGALLCTAYSLNGVAEAGTDACVPQPKFMTGGERPAAIENTSDELILGLGGLNAMGPFKSSLFFIGYDCA